MAVTPVSRLRHQCVAGSSGDHVDAVALTDPTALVMLVLGSGISFTDCGRHTLKGVPGQWQLFAVEDT